MKLRNMPQSEGDLAVVFSDAATIVRDENNLHALIEAIDELPWYDDGRDNFGDIYEGILERNAEESKRGAGQYFTPRVVVDAVVSAMRPQMGEVIQDPAAGTGGFLIGADEYITRNNKKGRPRATAEMPRKTRLIAMENVPDTFRLLLMNLTLHQIGTSEVYLGDTLSGDHLKLAQADLILSNPPFGPAGGRPTRDDLKFTAAVSNFQLPFVEHCLSALKDGGRAAIVVPDNVLFEEGRGRDLRKHMLDNYHLHTILRLPSGIFYATGVKTNIIFLGHGKESKQRDTWFYDLRTNMPNFGKSAPLSEAALADFLAFYGKRSDGLDRPKHAPEVNERFRVFTRDELARRNDNLDLTWLKEPSVSPDDDLTNPHDIARAIVRHLQAATAAFEGIAANLAGSEGVSHAK